MGKSKRKITTAEKAAIKKQPADLSRHHQYGSTLELVTDIAVMERLAKEQEDENWDFRLFLKNIDKTVEEIDAIVHRFNREVSQRIPCLECGHCCRVISPVLGPKEVARLAQTQKMTEQAFVERYLVKGEEGLMFRLPCPFQSGNVCTVYEHRPEQCQAYPHLHKEEFVFRLIQTIGNCSVCPIVFNVYQRLKGELFHHPNKWDDLPF